MSRLFDEHIKREVKSLSGTWLYKTDEDNIGEAEGWQRGLSGAHPVEVPSVWNSELDLLEYEGAAWYEKRFYTEGGDLRFVFGAVMTSAKVYLDGECLGGHYGGFCEFDFIVRAVSEGYHTLTVRADNSYDGAAIPQPMADWYHYGGITRDVTVERLSGIVTRSVRMEYTLDGDEAECRFILELYSASDADGSDMLTLSLDGEIIAERELKLGGGSEAEVIIDGITLYGIERWSPESPRLYTLLASTSGDDLYERVGFRTVEVKDGAVYLNGKRIRFRGVNRHEEHPDFGMAFPPVLMRRDLDIIKKLGCNSIRGSHYPNNPRFVDMLDEEGILFWSEIPIWGGGFSVEKLGDPAVVERGLQMHREMVKKYYNHPSIIIWGMHNEIDTRSEEAKEMSRVYYTFLKENGGNRIVTYATHMLIHDICLEYCDMVCCNTYVGWYPAKDYASWDEFVIKMRNYLSELGMSDKPVVVSEFGAAAIYGHHTFDNLKWTEEYQAKLISDCLKLFFAEDDYAGAFIWQFSDIRTAKEMGLNRARSFNNKGLVNEYRRPKLAYGAVREIYTALAESDEG